MIMKESLNIGYPMAFNHICVSQASYDAVYPGFEAA